MDAITAAWFFVEHQIPLFLLTFGIIFLGLCFVLKPLGQLIAMPIAVLATAVGVAWFTMSSGGIMAMPLDVMQVIGVGIVFMVLAKVFSHG